MAVVPVWPGTLPVPLSSGYSYTQKTTTARTEMDSGVARSRRRFRRAPAQINLKWLFLQEQLAVFEYFWDNDLLQGASWFDTIATSGTGPQLIRVRCISDGYTPTQVDPQHWEVTMQVEAVDMPRLAAEQYAVMVQYEGADIVQIDQAMNQFVHGTLRSPDSWGAV
ncbi:hypothetical protein [Cupriavidus sp. YAF13]|uniref:hypothetical protein n=1 Tax=Cupriavidus sp. YAF13 TaxID=3233075 RepID=UPI003F933293